MKGFKTIFLFIFGLEIITAVSKSNAQGPPFLDNFTATEYNNQVLLKWTIRSGNTCNGTRVFRSLDAVHFIEIGSIPGICGSASSPLQYSFTDENPVWNSICYYRIELSGLGVSETASIELISFSAGGCQVRPNPVYTTAKIYFRNSKMEPAECILHNINGTQVKKLSSITNYFNFDAQGLNSGVYFFWIITSGSTQMGTGRICIVPF